MTTLLPLLQIANVNSWENPQLASLNKLPPRATFYHFPSPEAAVSMSREQSPWFLSLNGTWEFQIKSCPEEVTESVLQTAKWTGIQVPGNWTMQRDDQGDPSIDAVMRGLGTASCGPDTLEQYQIRGKEYRFTYGLRLL